MRLLLLAILILNFGSAHAQSQDPIWENLFDARSGAGSLDGWLQSGLGSFVMDTDGSIKSQGGMGLFYYAEQQYEDFVLEVEWRTSNAQANSGVFVRFPKADSPWDAVDRGYEIQIDDTHTGVHQTGAVYSFAVPSDAPSRPSGEWNTFSIEVRDQLYKVSVNGVDATEFLGNRATKGFIGLQNHDSDSVIWFRLVRVLPLEKDSQAKQTAHLQTLAEAFAVNEPQTPIRVLTVTATHGFRHQSAIDQTHALLPLLNQTTEFQFDITENLDNLNDENLSNYDVLFFANATLRVDEPDTPNSSQLTFRPGDWRNYDASVLLPNRPMRGRIALSGTPDALTGMAEFDGALRIIERIDLVDDQLTMAWDTGAAGFVEVVMTLSGSDFTGVLTDGDAQIPIEGTEITDLSNEEWEIASPLTAERRAAILKFLAAGNGFAGAHAALDALYGWQAYREIVSGGLFENHPWTQDVSINIEDSNHASTAHLGDQLKIRDEIYVLDKNPRWTSHILTSLDNSSVDYNPGPPDQSRSDFPMSWVRKYGPATVFMTKLGHFPDVWTDPAFVQHLLQGLRTAAGRIPGDYGVHRVKETIAENVWPDDIAVDTQGNVWIAELRGKIHHYNAQTGKTHQIAHLPTTDPTKIEHGLLGIEVDPEFYQGQPYVYLYYTEANSFINTLSRFTYLDAPLDLDSEKVLLRVPTDPMCCHQAGDLEWGTHQTLMVSTGDTGMSETNPLWQISEQRLASFEKRNDLKAHDWSRLVDSERSAQNLQDLRGKILRINKDGTVPKDNPFFGDPGVRWEIYAYGLRNPYRFKMHPESEHLYIGVVGPDARFDYDEYNVAHGGDNFGWPRTIGRLFYNEWRPEDIPNYRPPLWEYTYATGARSATVGPVYINQGEYAFPEIFQGKVFISDWSRRWIKWAEITDGEFTSDDDESVKNQPLSYKANTARFTNILGFDQFTDTIPISMEMAPGGSLYVAEFDGFGTLDRMQTFHATGG
jgi:glucose/arabinose dehydrogenase